MTEKTAISQDQIVLPMDQITPYFRNPRRITPDAIEAVATSIERYGYQQPIVVDRNNVIVVGHTRFAALQKLGYTEVPVFVTDLPEDKVREYRLIDNKTSEMTSWDHNALVLELREFEKDLLETYFPDVNLEIAVIGETQTTQDDIDWGTKQALKVTEAQPLHLVRVECPACFHTFSVKATALPGLSGDDIAELKAQSTA